MTVASEHDPIGQSERDEYLDNFARIVADAPRSPEHQRELAAQLEAGE